MRRPDGALSRKEHHRSFPPERRGKVRRGAPGPGRNERFSRRWIRLRPEAVDKPRPFANTAGRMASDRDGHPMVSRSFRNRPPVPRRHGKSGARRVGTEHAQRLPALPQARHVSPPGHSDGELDPRR